MNTETQADLDCLIGHTTNLFGTIETLAIDLSNGRLNQNVLAAIEVLAAIGQEYMDEIFAVHCRQQRQQDRPVTNGQEA